MLNLHFFFLVVRDNFKILYIQINFPANKDYFCSNFKTLIVMHFFFFVVEKNGNNVILGHIAFCTVVFQQISVYL